MKAKPPSGSVSSSHGRSPRGGKVSPCLFFMAAWLPKLNSRADKNGQLIRHFHSMMLKRELALDGTGAMHLEVLVPNIELVHGIALGKNSRITSKHPGR